MHSAPLISDEVLKCTGNVLQQVFKCIKLNFKILACTLYRNHVYSCPLQICVIIVRRKVKLDCLWWPSTTNTSQNVLLVHHWFPLTGTINKNINKKHNIRSESCFQNQTLLQGKTYLYFFISFFGASIKLPLLKETVAYYHFWYYHHLSEGARAKKRKTTNVWLRHWSVSGPQIGRWF